MAGRSRESAQLRNRARCIMVSYEAERIGSRCIWASYYSMWGAARKREVAALDLGVRTMPRVFEALEEGRNPSQFQRVKAPSGSLGIPLRRGSSDLR